MERIFTISGARALSTDQVGKWKEFSRNVVAFLAKRRRMVT